MSRIRTTLDSVTKAVGSTDLISKFSRFKPGSAAVDSNHAEKALVKAEVLTAKNTAAAPPPETTMKEEEEENGESNKAEEEQVTEKPFVSTKKSTSSLAAAAVVSAASSSSAVAKQTMQLFHPTSLSTNMDETYRTLAHHINSYFGTSTQVDGGENKTQEQQKGADDRVSEPLHSSIPQKTEDHIPILSPVAEAKPTDATAISPPPSEKPSFPVDTPSSTTLVPESSPQPIPAPTTSPRKGFTHYLSYPRPSVQAFVGSYIAPLVPKFRGDSKSITAEKEKPSGPALEESAVEKEKEKVESEEEKAQKQQLLLQREKVSSSVWLWKILSKGSCKVEKDSFHLDL